MTRILPLSGPDSASARSHTSPPSDDFALLDTIRSAGHSAVAVLPGSDFRVHAKDRYTIDPADQAHYARLVEAQADRPVTHVVHAWTYPPSPSRLGLRICGGSMWGAPER